MSTNPSSSLSTASRLAEAKAYDTNKGIPRVRGAAFNMALVHTCIYGKLDILIFPNLYPMPFKCSDGGRILGRLARGHLRKSPVWNFAYQKTSALEYCHWRNVKRRDFRFEELPISQTKNVKIIDFGLSDLANPKDHYPIVCGSPHLATLQVLSAKVHAVGQSTRSV